MTPTGGWRTHLDRVRSGDNAAFAHIFDEHAQVVFRYCSRYAWEPDQAEDLTSTVFLEAWRLHSRAVCVEGSFLPWLLAIAKNVTRNANRSRRRHRDAIERLRRLRADTEAACDAEADAIADGAAVVDAMYRLSEKQQSVAQLCLVQQLSPAAAATLLGVPEGTVKSRLAAARSRLRALLQSGESDETADPDAECRHYRGGSQSGAPVRRTVVSWMR